MLKNNIIWTTLSTCKNTPSTAKPSGCAMASENELYLSQFQWTKCNWNIKEHISCVFEEYTCKIDWSKLYPQ